MFTGITYSIIPHRLTDAFNTTKDRVWFLLTLQPLTDAINAAETPASIIGGTLPNLLVTVKQMESLSRSYAKSGYLGIVFKKVILTTKIVILFNKNYNTVQYAFCSVREFSQ